MENLKAATSALGAKVAVVAVAAMPVMAFAADQPDVTEATTYIGAGVTTILAVFTSKYIVKGVILVGRWVGSVIGR